MDFKASYGRPVIGSTIRTSGPRQLSPSITQAKVHTSKNPRRAVSLFVGSGKGQGLKSLYEHQEMSELDLGPPTRLRYLIALPFFSSLSKEIGHFKAQWKEANPRKIHMISAQVFFYKKKTCPSL